MVGQGHILAHLRTLGQGDYQTRVEVFGLGGCADYHGGGQGGVGTPFDLVGRCHCLDLGGHGTHDETFGPALCGLAGGHLLDGGVNRPGVGLRALGEGGVAEVHQSVGADKDKLPGRCALVGVVVAEDTHDIAVALGERSVPEIRVARGAHVKCRAGGVGDLLVLARRVVFGTESCLAVGVGELHVVDAHQLALPFAKELAVGEGAVGVQLVYRLDKHRGDCRGLGHAVELRVLGEELGSHECGLVGVGRGFPFGIAELQQTRVAADIHPGEVDDDLLPLAVCEPEVVGVDRHGEHAGLVTQIEAFEDVAGIVRRNHAARDDVMLAVLLCGNLDAVRSLVFPEFLFDFENGGVGFQCGLGHLAGLDGRLDVVLAGRETHGRGEGHETV